MTTTDNTPTTDNTARFDIVCAGDNNIEALARLLRDNGFDFEAFDSDSGQPVQEELWNEAV